MTERERELEVEVEKQVERTEELDDAGETTGTPSQEHLEELMESPAPEDDDGDADGAAPV